MPYLDQAWHPSEEEEVEFLGDDSTVPAGIWIPERQWDRWQARNAECPLRDAWQTMAGPSADDLFRLAALPIDAKLRHLRALGADLASAQRDGFLYGNELERLKGSLVPHEAANDDAAESVVAHMQTLDLVSASWRSAIGGPPPHQSPRGWRRVADWLMRLIAKVARYLVNGGKALMALTQGFLKRADEKLGAIAIGVLMPSFGLEFQPDLFDNRLFADAYQAFIDGVLLELGDSWLT